jgi:hypothetical protein
MYDRHYVIKTEEYSCKISCYNTQIKVGGDNNTKGYMIVLQQCPEELQAKLENQKAWVGIDDAGSGVRLFILVSYFQYNKSN